MFATLPSSFRVVRRLALPRCPAVDPLGRALPHAVVDRDRTVPRHLAEDVDVLDVVAQRVGRFLGVVELESTIGTQRALRTSVGLALRGVVGCARFAPR